MRFNADNLPLLHRCEVLKDIFNDRFLQAIA